ncbi:zinc uptake transcriptional repressor Zur [Rosenbergiella australiborealis]|uniref:Zinc uptake transcriptional repressor Zur n=2 Tax=Rosenbergiella TaxID=1356488 RepID=A0ABS5T4G8_9GAMM|nr:zinc uptake transcriptional repressor Zur [Rosenbergiella australiborealis]MBT0727231.1 zinc uptake transcriptional repressor Zur [Rosenbergiella australiborealis]
MQPRSAKKIIADAEQLCIQRGVRLTAQRAEVLRLMIEHPHAISAYDLLDKLRISEPQAKPPTVYRALDFLLEQAFIHRVESNNSYVVCPHFDHPSHSSMLLICDQCASVTERPAEGIENGIKEQASVSGFTLRHSIIEAHGLCQACATILQCDDQEHCHHDHKNITEPKRKPGRA